MNREEARQILDANTFSGDEARDDAALREALEMAQVDDELRAWFDSRQDFDNRLADAVNETPVPVGLRDRILAAEISQKRARSSTIKVLMAMAAAVVVAGSWMAWASVKSLKADAWMKDSLAVITRIEDDSDYPLDVETHDIGVVKALLAKAGAPAPGSFPKNLPPGKAVGCKVFNLRGHRATIICFEVEPGVEAHLAVVEGEADLSRLPKDHPLFDKSGQWNTARWSGDGKAYMLATRGSAEMLKKLFA